MDIEALKAKIQLVAGREVPSDDEEFNAYDFSGGNYDDAFSSGQTDGETQFARELLAEFFPG